MRTAALLHDLQHVARSTVYREIFAVKKFSRLSVNAKISHMNFFPTKHRNSLPDPRGLLSSSIR